MSPEDAIEAARILRAKTIIPIHWGTFRLLLEPFNEPTQRLLKAAQKANMSSRIRILEPGQAVSINHTGALEISSNPL